MPRTDFARATLSSSVAMVLTVAALIPLLDDPEDVGAALVATFVVFYPLYALIYVAWSGTVYSRLGPEDLRRVAREEHQASRRWYQQISGANGTASATITAAVIAVAGTIGIALTPEFRGDVLYLVLGLCTVAGAWAVMVFSFAQSYLRLDAVGDTRQLTFPFPEAPRFGDYVTFTLLMSTMAATVAGRATTRAAWRLVRANVLVAFCFNSVLIAMMVSLLFGGIA